MGKFEKQNRPVNKTSQANRYVNKKKKKNNRLGLIFGIVISAVVIVGCALAAALLWKASSKPAADRIRNETYVAGVNVGNMTKEEALALLQQHYPPVSEPATNAEGEQEPIISALYPEENMNIRLYTRGDSFVIFTTSYDPKAELVEEPTEDTQESTAEPGETTQAADSDAPVDESGVPYTLDRTICLPASNVNVTLDLTAAVEKAYTYGRETEVDGDARVDVDLTGCMSLDEDYIYDVIESAVEDITLVGAESRIEDVKVPVTDDTSEETTEVDGLQIMLGTVSRSIDAEALYEMIMDAYFSANFDLQYVYEETIPEPVDLDALYETYQCVAPVDAEYDPVTYEITDETVGYGFLMQDAYALLQEAKAGDIVVLTLVELVPECTRELLESQLFCDVLGSYNSPHVWNPTRTRNLELASQAIDGTVILPGEEFSFNEIVGERTAEKGYGEAGVYVGGRTENQLGGGVCQVASTIYYCALKADLQITERYAHQFTPTYVPWGMDATIYWGSLDFRFRNNTAFPIRIDASVYDGYVHVQLVGTNTKEYTVKLDYAVVEEDPAEEKTIYIHPDMKNYSKYSEYKHGETIQTAYDGYKVKAYMYKYDLNGNYISTTLINVSEYDRRDKEIAYLLDPNRPMDEQIEEIENPSESESTEPTESESTAPTEPESTQPTEPESTETTPTETETAPTESEAEPTESEPPAE